MKTMAGGVLLGLVEQVPDAGGAHAHVELHKVGTGDGQEVDPRLPRPRPWPAGSCRCPAGPPKARPWGCGRPARKTLGAPRNSTISWSSALLLLRAGHVVKGDLLLSIRPVRVRARPKRAVLLPAGAPRRRSGGGWQSTKAGRRPPGSRSRGQKDIHAGATKPWG